MQERQQQLQVQADAEVLKGRYANMMQVSHTSEEFVLDFMFIHAPGGQFVARIVTSPGHLKRIIAALQTTLASYEQAQGTVEVAEEPQQPMGFQLNQSEK